MMDLSKTASALLDMLYEKPKPDHEAQRAIEAALKEAYRQGHNDGFRDGSTRTYWTPTEQT